MAKKILIVDDAAFMRLTLKNLIEEIGYEVIGEATNGEEAVAKYADLQPDIVTMDITMPEMSGLEALKEIISIDDTASIIMCSAMGQQTMVLDAIKSGAKDFIVKPFNKERIEEALSKAN
ncbi:response regulator [Halocella sp. SP3-1]|uniref:response regulator n=1 Tax=Halocella sp. SP3-1 TaxID=2382161 RepID=UPI000F757DDC|nr:response regulator [Halocella sp. SP3-1]AZO93344.1 response regulator [Halocella sp. SP3-1]MTI62046.1 response regulator [Bacillota bacterium]